MSQDEKKKLTILYAGRYIVLELWSVDVYKIYLQVYTANGVIVILLEHSALQ